MFAALTQTPQAHGHSQAAFLVVVLAVCGVVFLMGHAFPKSDKKE